MIHLELLFINGMSFKAEAYSLIYLPDIPTPPLLKEWLLSIEKMQMIFQEFIL